MDRKPRFSTLVNCLICIGVLAACNSPYTSKKRGYFSIRFPQRNYLVFDSSGFPFAFEYPDYARLTRDSTYFDDNPENPYWINLDMNHFNARLFLSYKRVGGLAYYKVKGPDGNYHDSSGVNELDKMINDAFTLTSKNEIVATSIRDSLFVNPQGVTGIIFRVGGDAATPLQFFMTDSARHFVRGALYFEATPNADSLRPAVDFVSRDIGNLVRTFRWKPS